MKNQSKKRKYTKRLIITSALGVATLATTGITSAHFGKNPEVREAIKAALDSKDYSAFQAAAAETKIIEKIDSKEKFEQIVLASELKESGDIEAAKEIKRELGLKSHKKKSPEVREAIQANNYTAFREAINDGHFAEKIDSAEKFGKLVEVNELRAMGEYEQARTIMEDLGISHRDRKDFKKMKEKKDRESEV